ncbi:uncharacterized protein LOC143037767 [Oratosquilla oratoria]|uniref:uncharacterized protein LOC143037767 n=1 Tax=Oratosquilla oratoria TaxID=337810 RepID=UPI003F76C79C
MLHDGVIEESTSPWRVQVLVVLNECHGKRLVVDYGQTINKFTHLDVYPLPRIVDLVTELSHYKYYSSLDLKSAYHQIPIWEEDKPYSAFEANNPECLHPLKELLIPKDCTSLRCVIGMFSYYSQWVSRFSDKIRPFITTDIFSRSPEALKAINDLKEEPKAVVHSIDETIPLVVETEASHTVIAVTLNQAAHPVASFSCTLTPTECTLQ